MGLNEALRVLAGVMILISLVLTKYVHPYFVWLTVFIAVNLIQSGFTKWCPAITIFKKMGLK
ncbi:MAG: rhodanese [Acidobacteria bacterium]|nr:MAG: rhodanese [Acidobacteriota bacterium]PIE89340.1 MAG: rhodanese [Acidobacteriota bacterium]